MEFNDDEFNATEINGPPVYSSPQTTHVYLLTGVAGSVSDLSAVVGSVSDLTGVAGSVSDLADVVGVN